MELDWEDFVDNGMVGNYWKSWALLDHWCFGPMRNLNDFSNQDCKFVNIDCWWALRRLHSCVQATFDEQGEQDTLRTHGSSLGSKCSPPLGAVLD